MGALPYFIYFFYAYLGIGFLFGLWFVFVGVNRLDPTAESAHWFTRLLFLPGSILLWPILLQKLARGNKT